MLGLKKGEISLYEHQSQWEENAKETINSLKQILDSIALDIQHIGSTAIKTIKAKPIIDIAIGVNDFKNIVPFDCMLNDSGFYFRGYEGNDRQPVYQCGIYSDVESEMIFLTHYIHVVIYNSQQWKNYINFRDYMNSHKISAKEYENVKMNILNKGETSLHNYHLNKQSYVKSMIEIANNWDITGRKVIDND